MRPTVSEQLGGMRRILVDVVAPELAPGYASEILRGVIKNMRMLEKAVGRIDTFSAWEVQKLYGLLERASSIVDSKLKARIHSALNETRAAAADSIDGRITTLRGLLAEAAPQIVATGDLAVNALVFEYVSERADRYPFYIAIPTPVSQPK